jgi:6-methylpretetramide 4-monooxygenase / 4-hydroxy-6-methylpretetramide 12a-monooxygenase
MLDVSYATSPLVGEHLGPGVEPPPAPGPGDRYPDRTTLTGTAHHVLLFGAADDAGAARLGRRWGGLVDVVHVTGDPRRAGLSTPGAVLVRPDGHIGFRAAPADAAGLTALEAHLDSYLVPA